jgi:drug/metabolite transporter (DMT)-like permease
MSSARLRAYFFLLTTCIIWGIAGPVIKLTLNKIPVDLFILYRFFISSLIALFIFKFQGFRLPKKFPDIVELVIYCVLNSSVQLGLLFWGTSLTSLLDMSLIQLFGPLLLVLSGYLFLKDRITHQEKIGTIIAFLGALIIGVGPLIGSVNASGGLTGNILIFLSLIAAAACGVFSKRLMRKGVSPSLLANLSFIIGFLTILPFVILKSGLDYGFSLLGNTDYLIWAGIFYMAVFSGNLAYILNNIGQKSIELSEAAPFAYLYPILSAILAIFILGEKLTGIVAIGSIISVIGIIIAEWKKKNR